MNEKSVEQAIEELTLMLLYLSRFVDRDIPSLDGKTMYHSWKGYDFGILNELNEKDFIRQGNCPSRSKSVYITDEGIQRAKNLMKEYGIEDRDTEKRGR